MKDLVYFPTFEPLSSEWLRFALLYMEEFNSIIPYGKLDHVSPFFKRIIDETDLVAPYSPKYEQGERAALKTIEFVDKILSNPHQYSGLFYTHNVTTYFHNHLVFKIYSEKYTHLWEDYCLKNKIGQRTDDGLIVSDQLAYIYMSFLAEEIAYNEKKSSITDSNRFSNFLSFQKSSTSNNLDNLKFAKSVVELRLPKNISNIPIERIIDFRNKNRKRITQFGNELSNSFDGIERGKSAKDFLENYSCVYNDLSKEILSQGLGIVTIPLTTYVLLKNTEALSAEYINLIAGGLGIVLTATNSVNSTWKEIAQKNGCRRYLSNLSKLS